MTRIKSDRYVRDKFFNMKSTPNPIQQVLQAEREASDRLERARQEAETMVSDTRRMTKQLLKRNEQRTQLALERFEAQHNEATQAEADRLRKQASRELASEQTRVDEKFDGLVEDTFESFWPE